ncbi:MAG: histidine phosphatase family protein, partial [Pseudomonadota bacterium]
AVLAGEPISGITASPLSRARITAEHVGRAVGLEVATDPDLMECHLGIWQGEPYQPWAPDYWRGEYAPEGGETFWQFRDRVWPAMARAVADGPNRLIVAHGGLWYAARSRVKMVPDLPRMPNALPLYVRPEGDFWRVTVLGDVEAIEEVLGA